MLTNNSLVSRAGALRYVQVPIFSLVLSLLAFPTCGWSRWPESAFAQKPLRSYSFLPPRSAHDAKGQTVIGTTDTYVLQPKDTLWDVARSLDLGWREMRDTFPGLDPWSPPVGQSLEVPALWVLPQTPPQGVVINLPELRLYYFLPHRSLEGSRLVVTAPVGLGSRMKQTPTGVFRVTEKTVNPTWVIPDSIRKERLQTKGQTEYLIPGDSPDNPLGKHRLRLTHPDIEIHGTNAPRTVGQLTSHGCIRLYPEDIAQLFNLIGSGTPVTILYQTVKIGVLYGKVYVEIHSDLYHRIPDLWTEAERVVRESGLGDRVDDTLLHKAVGEEAGVPVEVTRGADGQEARLP